MNIGEYLPTLSYLGTVAGLIAFFIWATVSGFRKKSATARARLEKSQEQLIQVIKDEAVAWKNRYETEHAEYWSYRQKVHDQAKETQAELLKLTAENADLKAKTDITPLLQAKKEQDTINEQIVTSLKTTTETLEQILKRLRMEEAK